MNEDILSILLRPPTFTKAITYGDPADAAAAKINSNGGGPTPSNGSSSSSAGLINSYNDCIQVGR